MKFKLDENFGARTQNLFMEAGHDAQTVRDEELSGAPDSRIFTICQNEYRCLVTLDLDFADVTRFSPQHTRGIIVVRSPKNPTLSMLEALIRQCLQALKQNQVEGQLWIIEPGQIRIHQRQAEE